MLFMQAALCLTAVWARDVAPQGGAAVPQENGFALARFEEESADSHDTLFEQDEENALVETGEDAHEVIDRRGSGVEQPKRDPKGSKGKKGTGKKGMRNKQGKKKGKKGQQGKKGPKSGNSTRAMSKKRMMRDMATGGGSSSCPPCQCDCNCQCTGRSASQKRAAIMAKKSKKGGRRQQKSMAFMPMVMPVFAFHTCVYVPSAPVCPACSCNCDCDCPSG